MSLLMNVYEKNKRQRKTSLGQQPQNAKRDQDLENAGGYETSREWCGDSDFAAYSPLARETGDAKRDQDLNVKKRSVASREWCDDAELEAPKEPRRHNQDTVMNSAVSGGIDTSQAAAYSPLTCQHLKAKRDEDLNVKRPETLRRWCDGADLEAPEQGYPEKYSDEDKIMKTAMAGDHESVSSQAAVVAAMNRRHGAYAVMQGRSMQHWQDDAGTTTATLNPTDVVSPETPPITAEIVEDTHVDISSHIRRVLENAVPACSVAAMNASKEWPDKRALAEGETSRHWRRLILVFLCLILLAVVAAVSVVVVVLTKDSQPTTRVTIVIKLDDNPEETGWELHQDGNEVVAFPPGSYSGYNNKEVMTTADVYTRKEYVFTLFDTGGDGIDGGYYKIYDAPDTSDPEALLVEGSGNFTDQVHEDVAPVGQEANEEEVDPALQGDEEECVDCEVTDWSDWSPCSADCDGGTRSRTRTVMISGTGCGNPCPPFVEMEPCNTELCPDDECPHECCGDTDCQQDEKCLENQCNPVCECGCSEPYTCNVEANCQCICPYECCKDGDCTGANQMCSSDYTCIPKPTDLLPCECDCPAQYTCNQENECECICPFECCKDGDCTGENQTCSGDYSCIPIPTDLPPCECACSSQYVCDVDNYCTCFCAYECCSDGDCGDGWECLNNVCNCPNECCSDDDCGDGWACLNNTCSIICDCGSPYTCDDFGACICAYECCSDGDCGDGWVCLNNTCSTICDCDLPYTCDDVGACICAHECCSDDDCGDGWECSNNVCNCPYECCSDDDCGDGWECLSNTCSIICDCHSPYTCDDFGVCICAYECCSNDDCGDGYECLNDECTEVCLYECCDDGDCLSSEVCVSNECEGFCECDCPSPYTCNDNCGCDCPYECCNDSDCSGGICVSNECEEGCECDCPSPYTCNDDCGCDCPYDCCNDGDCNDDEYCGSDHSCYYDPPA